MDDSPRAHDRLIDRRFRGAYPGGGLGLVETDEEKLRAYARRLHERMDREDAVAKAAEQKEV